MGDYIGKLDIEVYDLKLDKWAQAKYLVHGYTDVLWTDDIFEAAKFLTESILEMEEEYEQEKNSDLRTGW